MATVQSAEQQLSAVEELSVVLTVVCPGGQDLCCCELTTERKLWKESACHCLCLFFFLPLQYAVTLVPVGSSLLLFCITSPAELYTKRLLYVSSF